MCVPAKAPSSCQKLKELELHLNDDRWGRMLSSAQLFAPLSHTHKPQQEPYSICSFLSGITQCLFKADYA